MEEVWKDVLRENWPLVKLYMNVYEDLHVHYYLLRCLRRDGVISFAEGNEILSPKWPQKNDCLLRALERGGYQAFMSFIQALKPDHSFLANRLEEKLARKMQAAREQRQAERERKRIQYFPEYYKSSFFAITNPLQPSHWWATGHKVLCTISCSAVPVLQESSGGELDAQIFGDGHGKESFWYHAIFSNEILSNMTYRRPNVFLRGGMVLQALSDYQLRILDIPAGRFTKSRDEDNPLLTRELESYDKQSEKFRSLETYIEVGVTYRQNDSCIVRRTGRWRQKVKIKRSLTNSPISVQFSDGYATWSALCENFTVNDQHVDTRTKWMIQVVILCMTYIITRQKLSGELPAISCGKVSDSRWIFMMLLAACIFDGSSATSLKVFKSSEIESVGEGQGSITRLVQDKLSGLADVDLCCSICKPSIMKMDCDRFCDRRCPKPNVGRKGIEHLQVKLHTKACCIIKKKHPFLAHLSRRLKVSKSSTENTSSDSVAWILISDGVLVILVFHLYHFVKVESHTCYRKTASSCIDDKRSTDQSQQNGSGCRHCTKKDTCLLFMVLQELFAICPPSKEQEPHVVDGNVFCGKSHDPETYNPNSNTPSNKFSQCPQQKTRCEAELEEVECDEAYSKNDPDSNYKMDSQCAYGNPRNYNFEKDTWSCTIDSDLICVDRPCDTKDGAAEMRETEQTLPSNNLQLKYHQAHGRDTTEISVCEVDGNERENDATLSTAFAVEEHDNSTKLDVLTCSIDEPIIMTIIQEIRCIDIIPYLLTRENAMVNYQLNSELDQTTEQLNASERRNICILKDVEAKMATETVTLPFNKNVQNSQCVMWIVIAGSLDVTKGFDGRLAREVKHSIGTEKLRSGMPVLFHASRNYEILFFFMMVISKKKGRGKNQIPTIVQKQCFSKLAMGLITLKVLDFYKKDNLKDDSNCLMINKCLKRKREQTDLVSKQKKWKKSYITSCSDEKENQADNCDLPSLTRHIRQALFCNSSEVSNRTAATDLMDMKDLKALKQNMQFEHEQSNNTCTMADDDSIMQHYGIAENRCHDLPLRNYGNGIENPELPSPVTSRDSQSGWKREENLIASLRIRTIQPLGIEARTHTRELLTQYNKLYQHDYVDKKGKDEDDCHALRQATWLSGEDLPIPDLDYTVAVVHSPAQKILERLANGEHVGAHESMKYEILRVCTYRNYPGEDKPFRIQLASAGWYFASDGDEVVCYCCGLRKSGWKEIDNPMKIHELLRPTCDYLVKQSEVNIPIPELSAENAARFRIFESNESDSTRRSRQGEGTSNYDSDSSNPQYRFFTPPPKHPQYAEISTRLDTFKKWPTNIPQTAQIMAECGYYYAGFGDCVRCFHCGIGLRHWTEDDYPWVEHARWSKDCAYLRRMKGEEFIHNVHLAIDNDEEPEDLVPETPSGRPADMSQVTPNEDSSQILLTDPAQSVLTMGYQPRIIKRAIDIILHNEGRPGITAQKIMETIFMLEERDETSNLQEGLARINISNASGGPDAPLKDTPNTAVGNAATGQAHGRAHSEGEDKAKKDQQKDVKHQSKETRNNKGESQKSSEKHNEATAHSEEGGASEPKSKVKDTSKIKAENRKLKEQTVCKICLDKPVSIVFLPCGHLVTCAECAPAMRKCPICRALVKGRVKAFMS